MSIYPTYKLQVFDHVQNKWIDSCSHEASNRPHHYDNLRAAFERLVSNAREGASPSQAPIGYRILADERIVDTWDNGKVQK